jgi:hypothetical protein
MYNNGENYSSEDDDEPLNRSLTSMDWLQRLNTQDVTDTKSDDDDEEEAVYDTDPMDNDDNLPESTVRNSDLVKPPVRCDSIF